MTRTRHPTVSVILPTYNRASYLQQAIDSILSQTLRDWELIIVDDASTDSTPEVVRRFTQQDPRIRSYRHTSNQGAAAARNTGIQHATGTYITFQDDDDLSHPERLQKQQADLKKRPRHAYSRTWVTKFHTETPYKWDKQGDRQKQNRHAVGYLVTIMAPRELLHQVPFRSFFPTLEDHDLHIRLNELCLQHNKGSDTETYAPVLPHALYAVRGSQNRPRVSRHPLYELYFFLIDMSRLHRQYGLPDPINNANTIDSAIGNINSQYLQKTRDNPYAQKILKDFASNYTTPPTIEDAHRRIFSDCAKHLAIRFAQDLFDEKDAYLSIIKSNIYSTICHNQPDVYKNILRYMSADCPYQRALFILAPKILFQCLRHGRLSFIPLYVRALLKKTP
ncbi:MAG: glycosyltransferase family 2 protein [Alphaproteobacteria bacterium GM202ARS2]|nr:glycosyltransferase family 2 protein [Alphaproteobacteria bacterium GM202ARS2]